jgi:hypothetical protein
VLDAVNQEGAKAKADTLLEAWADRGAKTVRILARDAPEGNRWYFRIDWAKKRKCWYFRALGQSGQQVVAQSTSASEASARLQSIKPKPASKAASSASGSISTSPAGSAPPLRSQAAPMVDQHGRAEFSQ